MRNRLRRNLFRARRDRAGLSLIEIVIALFVFMFGVLGAFSLLPVAMDQAYKTVRRTRGSLLARYALATITCNLRSLPEKKGVASDASASSVTIASSDWATDEWKNLYVTITSGPGSGETRRIAGNSANTLTISGAWPTTNEPAAGSRFSILFYCQAVLDSAAANTLTVTPSPLWSEDQWKGLELSMSSGGRTGQKARILSNTADTLTVEPAGWLVPAAGDRLRIIRCAGAVATAAPTDTLTVSPSPGWTANQWQDLYVMITSGKGEGQARRIISNTADKLTLSAAWKTGLVPDTTSKFRIAPVAVDCVSMAGSARSGKTTALSGNQLTTDKTSLSFDTTNGQFFIQITSGHAAGRLYALKDITAGSLVVLVADTNVNFDKDGVRVGDTYYIIGNDVGVVSFPGNRFGQVGQRQTVPDPSYTGKSPYSYAIIFGDRSSLPTVGALIFPIRVDVLVFRNYDDSKTPAQNKKAVATQTGYLMPY